MKVKEDLSHLTEYERYCWLMLAHNSDATKEYEYFRDGDYHYESIGNIWLFMLMFLIVALICIPVAPLVGIPGAIIVLVVGCMALSSDYRIDHYKRRKFFEDNGVPNFEEYDEQPIPNDMTKDRLYYLVYKFKSERGYRMWRDHLCKYRGYPVYSVEHFARIKENDCLDRTIFQYC